MERRSHYAARTALPLVSVALLVVGCGWLQDRRDTIDGIHLEMLQAPPGYHVTLYGAIYRVAR